MMKILLPMLIAVSSLSVYYLWGDTPPPQPVLPPQSRTAPATTTAPKLVVASFPLESGVYVSKVKDNHAEYRMSAAFSGEFRVFGVSPADRGNSPVNHVSGFVTLASLSEVRKSVAQSGCERAAAQSAKTVAVVVTDGNVAERLERRAESGGELRLTGEILERGMHLFAGSAVTPSTTKLDLTKIYLVNMVEDVPLTPPSPSSPAMNTASMESQPSSGYRWAFSQSDVMNRPAKTSAPPQNPRPTKVIRRCPR